MDHNSTFDIKTADDFFRDLVFPQYQDFLDNNSSSRHALLSTITAYHVYEWVYRDKFKKDKFLQANPDELELSDLIDLARNIANGTKHFISKVETRTQSGFSSCFSSEFARPLIIRFFVDLWES